MTSAPFPELARAIERFDDKHLGDGVKAELVTCAEKALGVVLPPSHRWFLERYGWARFAHLELCGLGEGLAEHLDVVKNTQFERANDPTMPRSLVTILADGAGNHICLDTAGSAATAECAVVFWDHERRASDLVAENFSTWLIERIDQLAKPPDMSRLD